MYEQIRISKIDKKAILPTRNNKKDAGIDLFCNGNYIINPHKSKVIRTGIRIEIPKGRFGLIKPKGVSLHLIGAGVVDEGYQGEILINVVNFNDNQRLVITHGNAVAQLVLIPTDYPEIIEVNNNDLYTKETSRGNTGGIVSQLRMELGYNE